MQDLLYTHAIPNHLASTIRTPTTSKRQDHLPSRDINSNDVELLESGNLRCTIYSIPKPNTQLARFYPSGRSDLQANSESQWFRESITGICLSASRKSADLTLERPNSDSSLPPHSLQSPFSSNRTTLSFITTAVY